MVEELLLELDGVTAQPHPVVAGNAMDHLSQLKLVSVQLVEVRAELSPYILIEAMLL